MALQSPPDGLLAMMVFLSVMGAPWMPPPDTEALLLLTVLFVSVSDVPLPDLAMPPPPVLVLLLMVLFVSVTVPPLKIPPPPWPALLPLIVLSMTVTTR